MADFYKGDSKKKKKGDGKVTITTSNAPVLIMPKMVEKKKKNK